MLKLRDGIVELYKKVATSIPKDVEDALKLACSQETDPHTRDSLAEIVKTIAAARVEARPVCEDTGFPVFLVRVPKGLSQQHVREVIIEATRAATQKIPLCPNAVDPLSGANSGDNVGDYFPLIYTEESQDNSLVVDLMLRGGDCESLGRTYVLPALLDGPGCGVPEHERLVAERDLAGVRRCVDDAVEKALGKVCLPFFLGVAIGGARDQVAYLSRRQLLRRVNDRNADETMSELENSFLQDINAQRALSGAAPRTVAIGVKFAVAHRHPASFLVDVSVSCWAHRRGRLIW